MKTSFEEKSRDDKRSRGLEVIKQRKETGEWERTSDKVSGEAEQMTSLRNKLWFPRRMWGETDNNNQHSDTTFNQLLYLSHCLSNYTNLFYSSYTTLFIGWTSEAINILLSRINEKCSFVFGIVFGISSKQTLGSVLMKFGT